MGYGNYPDLSNVRKILVIKMRHLGDVLLSSPVFHVLKQKLPHAEIDALVYSESCPMLEGHPAIHRLISYDRAWKKLSLFKRLKKEIQLLRNIRKKSYDLVINLTEGDRGAIICRTSKAKIRVGFDPDGKGFFGKKSLYTHIVKKIHTLRHTVERNLDALRIIGISPDPADRKLSFAIAEKDKERMAQLLKEHGFSAGNYILIHPASRWKFKCWPIPKVRELIEKLLRQQKKIIITSGNDPEEMQMVAEILKGIESDQVLNVAGKINLKELGALIQNAESLLCVDSVSFHMASALKARVVALFGPTSDVVWGPWQNPNAKVLAQNFSCRPCYQDGCAGSKISDCLQTLPVNWVLAALEATQMERKNATLTYV